MARPIKNSREARASAVNVAMPQLLNRVHPHPTQDGLANSWVDHRERWFAGGLYTGVSVTGWTGVVAPVAPVSAVPSIMHHQFTMRLC